MDLDTRLAPAAGRAAVSQGDLAIVGYVSTTPYPSVQALVLNSIPSGTTLYLTTNTMQSSSGTFTNNRFQMSVTVCVAGRPLAAVTHAAHANAVALSAGKRISRSSMWSCSTFR